MERKRSRRGKRIWSMRENRTEKRSASDTRNGSRRGEEEPEEEPETESEGEPRPYPGFAIVVAERKERKKPS